MKTWMVYNARAGIDYGTIEAQDESDAIVNFDLTHRMNWSKAEHEELVAMEIEEFKKLF
jgi:hypothetical protein